MNVFIIDQQFNHSKRFQIMTKRNNGLFHLFPAQLFTLEDAKTICNSNNYNVLKIGTIYQCI